MRMYRKNGLGSLDTKRYVNASSIIIALSPSQVYASHWTELYWKQRLFAIATDIIIAIAIITLLI